MSEHGDLLALGFEPDADGKTLLAPIGSRVCLGYAGGFYALTIILPSRDHVTCVVSERALRITREGARPEPVNVDVDALMNIAPSSKPRPW
jgi:hypothetical protein